MFVICPFFNYGLNFIKPASQPPQDTKTLLGKILPKRHVSTIFQQSHTGALPNPLASDLRPP
jgi:hypothetical protein